jgi:hypothetical protein
MSSCILSVWISTWPDRGLNSDLLVGKSAINRLVYGTAVARYHFSSMFDFYYRTIGISLRHSSRNLTYFGLFECLQLLVLFCVSVTVLHGSGDVSRSSQRIACCIHFPHRVTVQPFSVVRALDVWLLPFPSQRDTANRKNSAGAI